MKVFLSHSSRDKALVREIRSHLPDHVKTWLDEDELLVGQDLKISIKSAIQEDADFVVIFLGKEAVASEWVKRELEWALEREKKIGRVFVLPVLLDDVWDMVQPAEFRDRLYIKCFDQSEDAVREVAQKLSDNIFSWLSRHLDESKRKDLEKKQDAEATSEVLKALAKMAEAFATEVPDHWMKGLRVFCTSIAGLAPQVQLDRLSSKIARELERWQVADRRTKESLEKGDVDEPLSKLGLTMTTIANGKMIEILENCKDELKMWEEHPGEVSPDAVLERIHTLLGVKSPKRPYKRAKAPPVEHKTKRTTLAEGNVYQRNVMITQPRNGDSVPSGIRVSGTYSREIRDDIWVIVWPERARLRGWPQSDDAASGVPALKRNGRWCVYCHFGGPPQSYEIAVYTAMPSASEFLGSRLREWSRTNDYRGISAMDLPEGLVERHRILVTKRQFLW